MGSDESRFNVPLILKDKITRQCPQTTTFEEKGEPNRIRTEVPPLTSLCVCTRACACVGACVRVLGGTVVCRVCVCVQRFVGMCVVVYRACGCV